MDQHATRILDYSSPSATRRIGSRFGTFSLGCAAGSILCLLLQLARDPELTLISFWAYCVLCPIGLIAGLIGILRRLRGIRYAVAGVAINSCLLIFEGIILWSVLNGWCP